MKERADLCGRLGHRKAQLSTLSNALKTGEQKRPSRGFKASASDRRKRAQSKQDSSSPAFLRSPAGLRESEGKSENNDPTGELGRQERKEGKKEAKGSKTHPGAVADQHREGMPGR